MCDGTKPCEVFRFSRTRPFAKTGPGQTEQENNRENKGRFRTQAIMLIPIIMRPVQAIDTRG